MKHTTDADKNLAASKKLTQAGYIMLLIFVLVTIMPSVQFGNEASIWTSWNMYLFIISSIAAPILFKRAKKAGQTRANTIGFWVSVVPLVLLGIFILGLLIATQK